ncbi:MAG: class I SAM-dependent methyltransferase [Candidatus Hydrogenedentes bacterium]|nr:class I SAM-dependent methyltransferase [Candidatus Hydrogenedentota bacterium]
MKSGVEKLLRGADIEVTDGFQHGVERYVELVREVNAALSLVSAQDVALLDEVHIPDALSLAPWVVRAAGDGGPHLDIGSGGGFPAIPLALLFPARPTVLVERSSRKAGFLQRVVGALKLPSVQVLEGEYPAVGGTVEFKCCTARAVEKPERVQGAILQRLRPGAVFLCQSGKLAGVDPKMFHVEHIRDEWAERGLRRGSLAVVSREAFLRNKGDSIDDLD